MTTTRDQFRAEWQRRAFQGTVAWTQLVSGLLALVAVPVGLSAMPDQNVAFRWAPLGLFVSIYVIATLIGLVRAPYLMFTELETERDELQKRLFNREVRQAAMGRLWELRVKGVEHRNQRLAAGDIAAWKKGYEDWRNEVLAEAKKISANLEAWLTTLDQVRPPPKYPIPFESTEHQELHRIMSEILRRMEEFLKAEMLQRDIATTDE